MAKEFTGTCGGNEASCERWPDCEANPVCPRVIEITEGQAGTFKLLDGQDDRIECVAVISEQETNP